MSKLLDRAGMTTATTGTGTVTLGSAVTDSTNGDFQTFAGAGAANLDVVNYLITDGNAWELGTGTYTTSGTTLSRTLGSSSTGSLLSLSGTAKVYSAPFATDIKTPNLTQYTNTAPTAPVDGSTLFSRWRAGRRMAAQIGPSNAPYELQPYLGSNRISITIANGSSAGQLTSLGWAAPVANGTVASRALATTSLLTSARRVGYTLASAAVNLATGLNMNGGSLTLWRGNAAGLGGFFFHARFGFNALAAGNRHLIGMTNSVTTTADPSSALDACFIGKDAADTNFQVMTNDASGTATKVDTGIAPATDKLYDAFIFAAPNGSSIRFALLSYDNTGTVDASFETNPSTDLPTSTTFMVPRVLSGSGTGTTGGAIDILQAYTEADF